MSLRELNPLILTPNVPIDVHHATDPDDREIFRTQNAPAFMYWDGRGVARIVINHPLCRQLYSASWGVANSGYKRFTYDQFIFGLLVHEVAHVLYGTDEAFRKLSHMFEKGGASLYIVQQIANILEDRRIEYLAGIDYPAFAPYIAIAQSAIKPVFSVVGARTLYEQGKRNKTLESLINKLYMLVRYGNMPQDNEREMWEFILSLFIPACRGTAEDVMYTAHIIAEYFTSTVINDQKRQQAENQRERNRQEKDQQTEKARDEAREELKQENGQEPTNWQVEEKAREKLEQETGKTLQERDREYAQKQRDLDQVIEDAKPVQSINTETTYEAVTEREMKQRVSSSNDSDQVAESKLQTAMENLSNSTTLEAGNFASDMPVLHDETDKFYRSAIASNAATIYKLRRHFQELLEDRRIDRVYEGDINIARQQHAYVNSLIGDEGKNYTVLRVNKPDADVVLFRDVSSSTREHTNEYTQAVISVLEALKPVEGVRTALVDFGSHFRVVKKWEDPINPRTIYPVSEGSTILLPALEEVSKWETRARRKMAIVITDGAISNPDGYRAKIKHLEERGYQFSYIHFGTGSKMMDVDLQETTLDEMPKLIYDLIRRGMN